MGNSGSIRISSAARALFISAVLLLTASTSMGWVAYQSDFTGTTLADAGLNEKFIYSGWIINDSEDRLEADLVDNTARSSVYTTNSWQDDTGFILNVTFNQKAVGTRFQVGIVTATYNPTYNNWATANGAYGIGFVTSGECSGSGGALVFNSGSGGCSVLSTSQGSVAFDTLQTLTIVVTAYSWSYSLNGQPSTTGRFDTPFDTSKSYRFIAHAQRGNPSLRGSYFTNITLSAGDSIPTLSEWGMIILFAGLVVLGYRKLKARTATSSAGL